MYCDNPSVFGFSLYRKDDKMTPEGIIFYMTENVPLELIGFLVVIILGGIVGDKILRYVEERIWNK